MTFTALSLLVPSLLQAKDLEPFRLWVDVDARFSSVGGPDEFGSIWDVDTHAAYSLGGYVWKGIGLQVEGYEYRMTPSTRTGGPRVDPVAAYTAVLEDVWTGDPSVKGRYFGGGIIYQLRIHPRVELKLKATFGYHTLQFHERVHKYKWVTLPPSPPVVSSGIDTFPAKRERFVSGGTGVRIRGVIAKGLYAYLGVDITSVQATSFRGWNLEGGYVLNDLILGIGYGLKL